MPHSALQLIARKGDETLLQRELAPGEYLLGRDPHCDLPIDSPEISRKHARLIYTADRLELEDVGGRYGTFINGNRVVGRQAFALGQSLQIGKTSLEVTSIDQVTPAAPIADAPASDRYQVLQQIASSRMRVVYLAQDLSVERLVVLKTLTSEAASNLSARRRFHQEARVLGQLDHPNIIPIHDFGRDPQDREFYAMKYVRGITIASVLEGLRRGQTDIVARYPLTELLALFQKICDAIAYAHSRDILHRDLKPANIMLGECGEVLVMDWGLAKILNQTEPDQTRLIDPAEPSTEEGTRYGTVMGTPSFMPPEQADGRLDAMDERTDIYALGAILYDILTLRPPITGATEDERLANIRAGAIPHPETYNRIRKNDPVSLRLHHCPRGKAPPGPAAIAMKALARDSDRRYPNVPELQHDLAAHQAGFAPRALRAGILRHLRYTVHRHATAFAAVFVFALVLLSLGLKLSRQGEALERLRGGAPLHGQFAQSQFASGQFRPALKHINLALELDPQNSDHHQLKADVHLALLQFPAARDAYNAALQHGAPADALTPRRDLARRLLAQTGQGPIPVPALQALRNHWISSDQPAAAQAMGGHITQFRESGWKRALELLGHHNLTNRLTRNLAGDLRIDLNQTPIRDLSPFKNLPIAWLNLYHTKVDSLAPLRGMPLTGLFLSYTTVHDLSPLRQLPLRSLAIAYSPVEDLRPLRGRPLAYLYLSGTQVTDLRPLAHLPLRALHLDSTRVTDLRPLAGLPLRELRLDGCDQLTEFSPLAELHELETLILPAQATQVEFLKKLPNLKRLSYRYDPDPSRIESVDAFWRTRRLTTARH